jgi:hypothetical protein
MITPATYNNLPFFAGDTFSLKLTWKDDAGDPFDLTGWGGSLRFVTSPIEDLVVLELTEADGLVLSSASPNIVATVPKEDTDLVTAPLYFILEVTDLSGVMSRLLQGTVLYKDTCDT